MKYLILVLMFVSSSSFAFEIERFQPRERSTDKAETSIVRSEIQKEVLREVERTQARTGGGSDGGGGR